MSNKVVIALGSNASDSRSVIHLAGRLLADYFDWIRFSEPEYTLPVGLLGSAVFLNQVAVARTQHGKQTVCRALKEIEKQLGRSPASENQGIVIVDIDLLQWNEQLLKPDDWKRVKSFHITTALDRNWRRWGIVFADVARFVFPQILCG